MIFKTFLNSKIYYINTMKNNNYLNWNEFRVLESTTNFINELEKFYNDYRKLSITKAFKKLF